LLGLISNESSTAASPARPLATITPAFFWQTALINKGYEKDDPQFKRTDKIQTV
jgi:hypothetical protein